MLIFLIKLVIKMIIIFIAQEENERTQPILNKNECTNLH